MPYCTNCGAELSNANQKFCAQCGIEIKKISETETKKEKNITIPITPSVPHNISLQDQKLFEIFGKFFIPVDYSNLYLLIPTNDQVFSSLLATIALRIRTGAGLGLHEHHDWVHFTTHVLITKLGIALQTTEDLTGLGYKLIHGKVKFQHTPSFFYWNDSRLKPRGKLLLGNNRLYIGNYLKKTKRNKTGTYEKDTYILLRKNFLPFCNLLRNNFLAYIEKLKRCVNNINLLKEYLNSYDTEEFIDKLYTFHIVESWQEADIILENTLELINREERKAFLDIMRIFAKFYMYRGRYNLATKWFDKILQLIPNEDKLEVLNFIAEACKNGQYFEKALEYYNMILELNPSDANALKNKEIAQELSDYENITSKDRSDAARLFKKGFKLYKKDQLEEAIELIKKALKKNPFDIRIRNQFKSILQKEGRYDEFKNYFED